MADAAPDYYSDEGDSTGALVLVGGGVLAAGALWYFFLRKKHPAPGPGPSPTPMPVPSGCIGAPLAPVGQLIQPVSGRYQLWVDHTGIVHPITSGDAEVACNFPSNAEIVPDAQIACWPQGDPVVLGGPCFIPW